MQETNRLFSYKMKADTGFAPNPFGGFLTLATCKPYIRESKNVDDWIAGFTSVELNNKYNQKQMSIHGGAYIPRPREAKLLIYLMQVTKKITFEEYWKNKKYQNRKPNVDSEIFIERKGDNIYKPLSNGAYEQVLNMDHDEKDREHDLKSIYILISNRFYYFGRNPLKIDENICSKIPEKQTCNGVETKDQQRINSFISFIKSKGSYGIYSKPHKWCSNDNSWEKDENYIKP
ncbi:hypothetical protein AGMMS50229_07260 [Campylobacterota bacterium]|nr:hypothetical protein AGMMS50229_07260 [Campylobacterota bacterium]